MLPAPNELTITAEVRSLLKPSRLADGLGLKGMSYAVSDSPHVPPEAGRLVPPRCPSRRISTREQLRQIKLSTTKDYDFIHKKGVRATLKVHNDIADDTGPRNEISTTRRRDCVNTTV